MWVEMKAYYKNVLKFLFLLFDDSPFWSGWQWYYNYCQEHIFLCYFVKQHAKKESEWILTVGQYILSKIDTRKMFTSNCWQHIYWVEPSPINTYKGLCRKHLSLRCSLFFSFYIALWKKECVIPIFVWFWYF